MIFVLLLLALILLPLPSLAALTGPPREAPKLEKGDYERTAAQRVTTRIAEYEIHVEGSVDGIRTAAPPGYNSRLPAWQPNRFVRIENIGSTDVLNPRLYANGRGPWLDKDHVVRESLKGARTIEEKARALWQTITNGRFHATTGDRESDDPVKLLNVYGYSLCGNDSAALRKLWDAAGIPNRRSGAVGHVTSEAYYDEGYHLFDSDTGGLYLRRDNRTIASQADLVEDHDLIKRTHSYSILSKEDRLRDERLASLYAQKLELLPGGIPDARPEFRYELRLRPNESIEWRWDHTGKLYSADPEQSLQPSASAAFCNGQLRYRPDLPESHSAGPLTWRIAAPYVLVGSRIQMGWESDANGIQVEYSRDGKTWDTVFRSEQAGAQTTVLVLDDRISRPWQPDYQYFVRVTGSSGFTLKSIVFDTDFQHSCRRIPELEAGMNKLRYEDDSNDTRSVLVTHSWVERTDWHPPNPPILRSPGNNQSVEGTKTHFQWDVPADPDGDAISDYHFQLSDRPDFRWPLSPTFDRLISLTRLAGKNEWEIPYDGLLNPDRNYYWRVRARDAKGVWSDWSEAFEFHVQGPGIPIQLQLEVEKPQSGWRIPFLSDLFSSGDEPTGARAVLRWSSDSEGRSPVRYRVYASDEKGFTPSAQDYGVYLGRGFCRTMKEYESRNDGGFVKTPANLLGETKTTWMQVIGHGLRHSNANRSYYRVTAIDEFGNESGPSDFVEAPHPLIYSEPDLSARIGSEYRYPIRATASLGDLSCKTAYTAAFWNREVLTFQLDKGPAWLKLDPASGLLSGTPGPGDAGKERIVLSATADSGSSDVQIFDLTVRK